MKESDHYGPCIAGLLEEGFLAHKIADGSAGKKPFDIEGATPAAIAMGIEVKSASKVEAYLDWRTFERHQVAWLRAFAKIGALSLAAVYCETTHVLMVWSLADATDSCQRLADYLLVKVNDKFVGWRPIADERQKQVEQQRALSGHS